MTATQTPFMTTEQLLGLPDDGIDRELIRGKLWETQMTKRNRGHGFSEAIITTCLNNWLANQPQPRGRVYSGEIGTRLRQDPDTTVGIDVAYFSAQTLEADQTNRAFIDGPPILAVEVLSPSDDQRRIHEKVREYLDCGIKSVWVVDPAFRTVTIYRPDAEPVLFNATQTLSDEANLPGFSAAVDDLFD